MSTPIATTTLKPTGTHEGEKVCLPAFSIAQIPGAMDNMKWKVAAQLMRRWFTAKPAWLMPVEIRTGTNINTHVDVDYLDIASQHPERIDDQIVKMDWALGFEQVREAFDKLYRTWNSDAGITLLKRRLQKVGWKSEATVKLGYKPSQGYYVFNKLGLGATITSAKELDMTCQINALPFGKVTDTLNDFLGAIYKATLKVAVVGTASYDTKRAHDVFKVDKLGFYIRDTYDFNEGDSWKENVIDSVIDPGLGVWSKDRVLSKKETLDYLPQRKTVETSGEYSAAAIEACRYLHNRYPGFVLATNKDFRDWRNEKGEGCDFFVFSDVCWVEPNVREILIPR